MWHFISITFVLPLIKFIRGCGDLSYEMVCKYINYLNYLHFQPGKLPELFGKHATKCKMAYLYVTMFFYALLRK